MAATRSCGKQAAIRGRGFQLAKTELCRTDPKLAIGVETGFVSVAPRITQHDLREQGLAVSFRQQRNNCH